MMVEKGAPAAALEFHGAHQRHGTTAEQEVASPRLRHLAIMCYTGTRLGLELHAREISPLTLQPLRGPDHAPDQHRTAARVSSSLQGHQHM